MRQRHTTSDSLDATFARFSALRLVKDMAPRTRAAGALLAGLALAACGASSPSAPPPPEEPAVPDPVVVPALGSDATLDVVPWNLLFFGAPNSGPSDELLQLARVRDVILGTDADLWAVQEVVSKSSFDALLAELPGYGGVLASDSAVTDGSAYYGTSELKTGLIYKRSAAQLDRARVVLGDLEHEFAGRPPLEVHLRLTVGGGTAVDAVVLVIHAKANWEVASWERRMAAAAGLKKYLDETWPTQLLLVPGDWNDDLDESITPGRDTPYRNFLDAAPVWEFPPVALGEHGATPLVDLDPAVEHILASDEAMASYQAGSAQVYRADEHVPAYRETTRAHLPPIARLVPAAPAN